MRTITVVDIIRQYLMAFGPLLGDIKQEGFYPSMLDRLSIKLILYKIVPNSFIAEK